MAQMTWIPCEVSEPVEEKDYLVTWSGFLGGVRQKRFIYILEWSNSEGWLTYEIEEMGYKDVVVFAWMPAPRPYQGKENDKVD